MENNKNDHKFSLFKPNSEYGKKNRNIIITIITIWFVAIFGFQTLLIITTKPTPEKAYEKFEAVWESIKNGNATDEQKQEFIKSVISVEGKSALKPEKKVFLDNIISWVTFTMLNDSLSILLSDKINLLKTTREKLATASDAEYNEIQNELKNTKTTINQILANKLNIVPTSIEAMLLPYCLMADFTPLTQQDYDIVSDIMKQYLIHNQSFLTDTKFLGFPFHYFYTAVFLLMLFVALCLIYSNQITKLQKRFSIQED